LGNSPLVENLPLKIPSILLNFAIRYLRNYTDWKMIAPIFYQRTHQKNRCNHFFKIGEIKKDNQ